MTTSLGRFGGLLLILFFFHGHNLLGQSDTLIDATGQKEYERFKAIGIAKQNALQLDSSIYYFKRSLSVLRTLEKSPINQFYNEGFLKNRISLNLFNSGQTEASITWMKEAIFAYQEYSIHGENEEEKLKGKKRRLSCIDNLGGFYRGIGENERGLELVKYSYNEKLKFLEDDDPNLAISRLIIGHISLVARDFEEAGVYTDKGLEHIDKIPYAHTYALMVRASIYENVEDFENAQKTYEACEAIYRKDFTGTYSLVFLDALAEMSRFYAKIGQNEKAITLAEESYNFTKKETFSNDLITFNHIENLAFIHFDLEDYQNALAYSNEALSYFSNQNLSLNGTLDSIQNEMRKPRALYLRAKSQYHLTDKKDKSQLVSLLKEAQTALSILDRRKTNTKTQEDLNLLLIDNNDLINFTKQLRWDLYAITEDEAYLDDMVSLHESALYTRIRSRLNLKNVAFSNVPKTTLERESLLKEQLSAYNEDNSMEHFFKANSEWNAFLDSLKRNYPRYYKMRYMQIEQPIDNLQQNIPDHTTVVRYLFVEEELYVLVVSKTQKKMIALASDKLTENILLLGENQGDLKVVLPLYHLLYRQLWQPIAPLVTTKKVVIVPDGALFNLSFETLTPVEITTFQDLTTQSLLAKHSLSYNYSLLLLHEDQNTLPYEENFIAFAPEFNDAMKKEYQVAISDSIDLDKAYLTLLPQPFSAAIAKEYSERFSGNSFLNEKSTKQLFTANAKEHKIIHIGTHAESNNLNPELSRLVFAKNIVDPNKLADNYLYTYEIYNQNLSSNLAILTACETGKPTFQPGEGMISLAHAFNYAGSESILTSLWKIDEKSSTEIIGHFYENLKKGMSKDEALRHAKLTYLSAAEGRTVEPQYWAGLVLMGDVTPIDLPTGTPFWIWILGGAVLLIIFFYFLKRKRA
ncbi:MAG: CHAT domain-containing protein [Bacteroidota bacterium]